METLEKQMVLMSKLVTAVREAASAALQSDTAVLERLTDVCQEEERQQTEALARQVMKDEERLSDQSERAADSRRWLETIREYSDIRELDAETLQRLIREITIHETIDRDGTRHITAEIHFNMKPLPEPLAEADSENN